MSDENYQQVIARANQWLDEPIGDIATTAKHGQEILANLQALKPQDPAAIGPLIGQIGGAVKRYALIEKVDWVELSDGRLALGHRPSKQRLLDLCLLGASHILTLLSGSEGALEVKKMVEVSRLTSIWFPMESGKPPADDRRPDAIVLFDQLEALLDGGASIYVHCSAGIHRTGMIANGLLRHLGHSQIEANKILLALRQDTADGVGDERKTWGDQFYREE